MLLISSDAVKITWLLKLKSPRMGKNLINQARGKGSTTYRAPSFKYKGASRHRSIIETEVSGQVIDLIHCRGHSAPLMGIEYDDGEMALCVAPENIRIGQTLFHGGKCEPGNVLMLKHIPDGTFISNIEIKPGDGGKLVRSSGTFARVDSKSGNYVIVTLPSKKQKKFGGNNRAMIGVLSGGGRVEKPFMKAGKKYHQMRAKNKLYPHVSALSMNAVDHPFGGTHSHKKNMSSSTSRNRPPGRKVGLISSRRTGRKKR